MKTLVSHKYYMNYYIRFKGHIAAAIVWEKSYSVAFFPHLEPETHGTICCVCFAEPFPAFKSWQEDSESGEAQLSPQAGRMNHHTLEEDCPPVLSHRSLDFGQSQRFLHDPEMLDSSSKALSFARYVIFMFL